ncbi:MAG: ATP-binding protein [Myxococcales bacterium]
MPHTGASLAELRAALAALRKQYDALKKKKARPRRPAGPTQVRGDARPEDEPWARSHYARLFAQAPLAYLVLDDRGSIIDLNGGAAELLGRDPTALMGKPFVAVARMSDAEPFWLLLRSSEVAGAAARTRELRVSRGDGEARMLQASVRLTSDPLTRRPSFLLQLVDVEDYWRASAEAERVHRLEVYLRAQLERAEAAQAIIAEVSAEVQTVGFSKVLEAIADQARHLGDADAAAVGVGGSATEPFDRFAQVGTPEIDPSLASPSRASNVLARVQAGEKLRLRRGEIEGAPLTPRGTASTFLGLPVRYRNKQVASLYLFNKRNSPGFDEYDERFLEMLAGRAGSAIEAAHAAEREAARRAWLQAVIDQMPEGVWLADSVAGLVANRRAHELGLDPDRPGGAEVSYPNGLPLAPSDSPSDRALQGEAVNGLELLLRAPHSELVNLSVSATPVLGPDGARLGAVTIWRDVTAVKAFERLREEWVAMIAHDLRQPLTSLVLAESLLAHALKGEQGSSVGRVIDRIGTTARRMNRMVDDLLDSTLIEAKQLKLKKVRLSLPDLIQDAIGSTATAGHTVRVAAGTPPPEVLADRDRLARLVENLLSNAVKYSNPGSEIVIELEAREREAVVSIGNEGKELSQAELASLFSRFYRTHSAQAGEQSGHGLGLFIAKSLVEAHGGRIWADSASGRTVFHFALPLADASPPAA